MTRRTRQGAPPSAPAAPPPPRPASAGRGGRGGGEGEIRKFFETLSRMEGDDPPGLPPRGASR